MEPLKAIPGMRDLFPTDTAVWDNLRRTTEEIMSIYAYGRIETPLLESAELFARGVGEDTDMVQKEMYALTDRGGRHLALRPEGTAGVVRAFIEARLDRQRPTSKLWYWGPMFRAERPQKGRYRQFWQFGVEAFGITTPRIDAEQISLAMHIAAGCGLDDLTLRLNSIGDEQCRPAYRDLLRAFLLPRSSQLCENCRRRLATNPLRVLDCKEAGCRRATADAPLISDHLCDGCREHLDGVRDALDRLGVAYRLDGRIVRGLDYYQRTAFELESARLGAQSSILGGGRYDGLMRDLGGPDQPGVGWAAGIERFLMAAGTSQAPGRAITTFVAGFPETRQAAFELVERLRREGIAAECDYLERSLKAQLKEAARTGARFATVLGPEEWARSSVILRDLQAGEQTELSVETLISRLRGPESLERRT